MKQTDLFHLVCTKAYSDEKKKKNLRCFGDAQIYKRKIPSCPSKSLFHFWHSWEHSLAWVRGHFQSKVNNSTSFSSQYSGRMPGVCSKHPQDTYSIFFTFRRCFLLGPNVSYWHCWQSSLLCVPSTLRASLKWIWKEQSRMPSAVQEAQVGCGRLISRWRGRGNLQAAEGDKWGTNGHEDSHGSGKGMKKLVALSKPQRWCKGTKWLAQWQRR